MYVLPVQCKGCGTLFDLWYDLQEQDGKAMNQHFCWRCRKSVFDRIKTEGLEEDESDFSTFVDDGLELDLK